MGNIPESVTDDLNGVLYKNSCPRVRPKKRTKRLQRRVNINIRDCYKKVLSQDRVV